MKNNFTINYKNYSIYLKIVLNIAVKTGRLEVIENYNIHLKSIL